MFGNKGKKTKQQTELDKLIKEHQELCKEVRQRIKEYDSLNREFSSLIAKFRKHFNESAQAEPEKENDSL